MSLSEFDLTTGGLTAFAARKLDEPIADALRGATVQVRDVLVSLHSDISNLKTSRYLTQLGIKERTLELAQAAEAKLGHIENGDYASWQKNADALRAQLQPKPLPGDSVIAEMQSAEVRRMLLQDAPTDFLRIRLAYQEAVETGDLIVVSAIENCGKYMQQCLLGPDFADVIDDMTEQRAQRDNPDLWAKYQTIALAAKTFSDTLAAARGELQTLGLSGVDPLQAIAAG